MFRRLNLAYPATLVSLVVAITSTGCPSSESKQVTTGGEESEATRNAATGSDGSLDLAPDIADDSAETSPGGAGEDGGTGIGNFSECNTRTITQVPEYVYITIKAGISIVVEPEDSPLAKLLFGYYACDFTPPLSDMASSYRVGPDGIIEEYCIVSELLPAPTCITPSVPQYFRLNEGCLELGNGSEQSTADSLQNTVLDQLPQISSLGGFAGECADNQIAIYRSGAGIPIAQGEPYFCVDYELIHNCMNCDYADGRWRQTTWYETVITAMGSLSGVYVFQTDCTDGPTVDITEGDQIRARTIITTNYEIAPPPSQAP